MITVGRVINFVVFFVAFVCLAGLEYSAAAQGPCAGSQMLTAKNCAGDAVSAEDRSLFEMVNKYRTANGRPALRLSTPLSILANRRVLDMRHNTKSLDHSWSNCRYVLADQKTWSCMMDSPRRLNTGYSGQGYETLYRTAGAAAPNQAIEAWKKSSLHNSIILNLGMFKDMSWDEVGVAVDGEYAVLWFGHPGSGGTASAGSGLGVTYEQAVAGLSKVLTVTAAPSASDVSKWQGYSADKKIKLDIFGTRKDISEATIAVSMTLESGKLSPQAKTALSTLLKNLFPSWTDSDAWITSAVAAIGADQSVSKSKILPKALVEISAAGGSLRLNVTPGSKPRYIEM